MFLDNNITNHILSTTFINVVTRIIFALIALKKIFTFESNRIKDNIVWIKINPLTLPFLSLYNIRLKIQDLLFFSNPW